MKQSNHIRLSLTTPGSLQKAIDRLESYSKELETKRQLFVKRLGEYGLKVLDVNISQISPEHKGDDIQTTLTFNDSVCIASIIVSGQQVAFIEFGAGVLLNTAKGSSLHPKGAELGFTIGSYNPNSKNAESPYGWYYKDENGQKHHTRGTPTFAPLHNAEMSIIDVITLVAREVFS